MTEILIPTLYLLAGIMVYATLLHLYSVSYPLRDPIQLLFGFMCLVTIPFIIFHAQLLQATDLPGFVTALKSNISSALLFNVLLPWFIALYTGRMPLFFLSSLSVLFALLLIANLVLPFSVQYEQLDGIRTQVLPWGETITRGFGRAGVWTLIVIVGVYMTLGFALFALFSKYRASRQHCDMYMLLAVGFFFVSTTFGLLTRLSIINFVEPGPLGMLAMVIAMSVILLQKRSDAEKEVSKLKNWQQTLLDSADYSIISTDVDGIIISFNAAAQRMLGYLPEELIGKHSPGILHDTAEVTKRAAELSKELGGTVLPGFEVFVAKAKLSYAEEREWTYIRKDGSRLQVRLSVTAMHGSSREITGYMGIAADLTERNQAQSKLRDSNSKYQRLFESAGDCIFLMEGERFVDCNPATLKIFGCTRDQIIGEPPYRFSPEFQPDGQSSKQRALEKITEALKGGALIFEWQHCRYDGTPFEAEVSLNMVEIGEKVSLLAFVRDITERKAVEKQIKFLAFYDPLTNLPNRQLLVDRLKHALASSARSGRNGAVLFIDLDNFKSLNDTLGHLMGDMLLRQVAERLTDCIREGDTVARLGGDEFVVILEDLKEQSFEAAELAEVVGEKILTALEQEYILDDQVIQSSASIGVTIFSGEMQDSEELLKQADIAMYQAKKTGRNNLHFFNPQMQETILAKVSLERELHKAVESGQFQLHYQIQMDSERKPLGAEALIRWIHPERGIVSPADFIPLAEESRLILSIGRWVLDTACTHLKSWERDETTKSLFLAVNVSALQFHQADFVAQVRSMIEHHTINPKLLKLELTESLMLEDIESTISTMDELSKLGVGLSLDDFGTGYSSLQYLKRLPLNQLKIDQSFVHDIHTDPSDAIIVATIIAMADALGLEVIAEGVETEAQRQLLLNKGCKHYQGYLFGKPVPIGQLEKSLMNC